MKLPIRLYRDELGVLSEFDNPLIDQDVFDLNYSVRCDRTEVDKNALGDTIQSFPLKNYHIDYTCLSLDEELDKESILYYLLNIK